MCSSPPVKAPTLQLLNNHTQEDVANPPKKGKEKRKNHVQRQTRNDRKNIIIIKATSDHWVGPPENAEHNTKEDSPTVVKVLSPISNFLAWESGKENS